MFYLRLHLDPELGLIIGIFFQVPWPEPLYIYIFVTCPFIDLVFTECLVRNRAG